MPFIRTAAAMVVVRFVIHTSAHFFRHRRIYLHSSSSSIFHLSFALFLPYSPSHILCLSLPLNSPLSLAFSICPWLDASFHSVCKWLFLNRPIVHAFSFDFASTLVRRFLYFSRMLLHSLCVRRITKANSVANTQFT